MQGNRVLVATSRGGRLEWRDRPAAGPGQVLVRVELAGVCRTDVAVERGQLEARRPVVLGHELTGRVVDAGPDSRAWVGRTVVVMPVWPDGSMLGVQRDGGFARFVVVDADRVRTAPPGLPATARVFAEPVAACLAPSLGIARHASVFVLGEGRIAALTARCLRAAGMARVGQGHAPPSEPVDCLVETTGCVDDLDPLLDCLKAGGTLVLKSRRSRRVAFDAAGALRRNLSIRATAYADFDAAVALLADPTLHLEGLSGPIFALDDWARAFAHGEATKAFIDPWAEA